MEGIEDIDCIIHNDGNNDITHIQLKYSTQRQNASFLADVLKNFLEVYLKDINRKFKLVYDFDVADGNLSNLFKNNLTAKSTEYWKKIIAGIKAKHEDWDWNGFSFEAFISKVSFEKVEKRELMQEIEKKIIEKYDIITDNLNLFFNGIQVFCLNKMEHREYINKNELDSLIYRIKDDISKGFQNPAHKRIKRIDFKYLPDHSVKSEYFEGKKATPLDIALQLPVRRLELEKETLQTIKDNKVTVIKASSGQGKTTLALQVAYNLQQEYAILKTDYNSVFIRKSSSEVSDNCLTNHCNNSIIVFGSGGCVSGCYFNNSFSAKDRSH